MELNLPEQAPRLLREDRTGRAILKCMEHGLKELLQAIQSSQKLLYDVRTMPEWRLDELAWEYNVLWYDASADIETKREWILKASEIVPKIGTELAIDALIDAIYGQHEILNYTDFGGVLHSFMLTVSEPKGEYARHWSNAVLKKVLPLRCTFDGLGYQNREKMIYIERQAVGEHKRLRSGTFAAGEDRYGGLL